VNNLLRMHLFEMPGFTDSKDMIGAKNYFENGSRDPDHAH